MDLQSWWDKASVKARRQLMEQIMPDSNYNSRRVYLSEVRRNRRKIGVERAVLIEKLTGGAVRAWTLRPDVFPRGTRIFNK